MLLYNSDVDEAERNYQPTDVDGEEEEDEEDKRRSFFDLRQRTLVGLDPMPAFRVVCLGLLRKLRTNTKGAVLYGEVEDSLGRYFRLLDADMQRFATLHETLRDTSTKLESDAASSGSAPAAEAKVAAKTASVAQGLLQDGMREIAVVLLACGEMQRRALELKMSAQRSVAMNDGPDTPPLASFAKFAEFLEEALAVGDQLRRKHEELQQMRMRSMAKSVDAKNASKAAVAAAAAVAVAAPSPTAIGASGQSRSAGPVVKPNGDGGYIVQPPAIRATPVISLSAPIAPAPRPQGSADGDAWT